MLDRIFPHPYLTLGLTATWMLLVNEIKLGSLVLGGLLGVVIPLLTAPYWPGRARIRSVPGFVAYILLVMWDIVLANVTVARIVLFMPNDRMQSCWIIIPLDLRTPEAITMLAGTITLTPGTVTAEMSACGGALLVHALHAPLPDKVRDHIKSRYETRLQRIFE